MKKQLLIIIFVCITSISQAQIHEVGTFIGYTNYIGDIGSYISLNKFAGGIIYKRNINTRIALRGTLSYLPIGANDANATNSSRKNRNLAIGTDIISKVKFKNNIIELAVGMEYNFFEYDVESSDKAFTPYILLELAGFTYKRNELTPPATTLNTGSFEVKYKPSTTSVGFAIPFGLGFKVKLLKNITFAVETKFRYTFKDDLDSTFMENLVSDFEEEFTSKMELEEFKNNINGNGNDWYIFTGFSLVYTFTKKRAGKAIWLSK